ncbi:MAG: hypothetical protein JKX71_13450 [Amylibacter sp.]|nr:hypothetical protein [Amylibacter sp.]
MKWKPFTHTGNQYDLSHLHPFKLDVTQPETTKVEEKIFQFKVIFSLHCFSKTTKEGDDPLLEYSDNRETRTFCFERYQLSFQLPAIIRDIHKKRCNHTGKGNFFIIELSDDDGNEIEYEIYFDIDMAKSREQPMTLYIQSAYVRDDESKAYRHKTKKIGFYIIAYNKSIGKPIKTPR